MSYDFLNKPIGVGFFKKEYNHSAISLLRKPLEKKDNNNVFLPYIKNKTFNYLVLGDIFFDKEKEELLIFMFETGMFENNIYYKNPAFMVLNDTNLYSMNEIIKNKLTHHDNEFLSLKFNSKAIKSLETFYKNNKNDFGVKDFIYLGNIYYETESKINLIKENIVSVFKNEISILQLKNIFEGIYKHSDFLIGINSTICLWDELKKDDEISINFITIDVLKRIKCSSREYYTTFHLNAIYALKDYLKPVIKVEYKDLIRTFFIAYINPNTFELIFVDDNNDIFENDFPVIVNNKTFNIIKKVNNEDAYNDIVLKFI